MTHTTTATLNVGDARLYYEVRGSGPLLLMIPGAPADAGSLAGLAAQLADRYTVVTYDQRGLSRSGLTGTAEDQHVPAFSEDAYRLITSLGAAPAYVVGTSGGALTGLDLIARHPDRVRALIAHEPPIPELLTASARWRATFQEVHDTYRTDGVGAAMLKFMATIDGGAPPVMPDPSQLPPEVLEMMGRIQGNMDYFFSHVLLPVLSFEPDISALRSASPRIVVGIGVTSPAGVPLDSARALAELLDVKAVEFPGGHQGIAMDVGTSAELIHDALDHITATDRS
ncbi:alpha/beta fold hydrolase [Stackebrandtia soli]|uniref:alpha/beta fold hydrolase n=1 Tax=Stackebrandtia soli TaxID=1892856 RepID=UPI0039EA2856